MNSRFSHFQLVLFIASFILFFYSALLIPTPYSYAQVPISIGGLELSLSTETPAPGQNITITAKSYTIEINSAKISWSVDGKIVKEGIGSTILNLIAPALGKKTTINVTATTPDGTIVRGSTALGSGSIDLIVETDGYVSQQFRGKIFPVYQNAVKIIAIPHMANSAGVEYDPKVLTYQWKRNDRVIEDQSGYGNQAITLVGDIVPRAYDLSVTVWPRDNSARAQGDISIGYEKPFINFYVDDPLYGPLFNKAIGKIIRIGSQKETSVLAVPYGFTKPKDGIGDLKLSWLINGIKKVSLDAHESVVLRAPDGAIGSSNVQLDVINTKNILQGVSDGFTASFSSNADSSRADSKISF